MLRRSVIAWSCAIVAGTTTAEPFPERLTWPDGQVLPHFAAPSDTLDVIEVQSLTRDEQITFSALAGLVNRTQPRIAFLDNLSEEGRDTWLKSPTVDIKATKPFDSGSKYQLLASYAEAAKGLVLYDADRNPHMRNLACTVAGLRDALPVTSAVKRRAEEQGVALPVLVNLARLNLLRASDVYSHLYDEYWEECEKRFIVSARPFGSKGNYHKTRDLAAACGAATVWLDCRDSQQRTLFKKFLADMPAGNAVVLGWYTTERSGVTTATQYGIGTIPADYFMNATVFAGGRRDIFVPDTPECAPLANKLYVALFLSDGDNVQYVQHAMRKNWDRSSRVRGKMPLNWTVSPALVDIAPGILNYYYSTATPNDCFVGGPSGMGYCLPVNTLEEPGAALGCSLDDPERTNAYTRITSRYIQRAGLRIVTVWDNLTSMQRQSFERNCPTLLGVTVHNFKDDPTVESSLENARLKFERLAIAYAGSTEQLEQSISRKHANWDRKSPCFLAYQANAWRLKPDQLIESMSKTEKRLPNVEFVRADHYFELQKAQVSR